jgi:poly-gamma-glutamate capsule biosynthesis protein CapA/YwtB (metallophosphatase superfamily)
MRRRDFLLGSGFALLPLTTTWSTAMAEDRSIGSIRMFLAGDVMTGRGIDQILPHPADPRIYEGYLKSARDYVALSEERFGPLKLPVGYAYPWGDALEEMDRFAPDFRIINLETAVTSRGEPWPGKGIHYRMHPANLPCVEGARPDCSVLANNHVLDWGYQGFADTLNALEEAQIKTAGAGNDGASAARPAVLEQNGKRVLVYAWGMESSGVSREWAAGPNRAGVNFLEDLSQTSVDYVADTIKAAKRPGDLVVVSLHWGSNWGYAIPRDQRRFAHALIDEAGVDVIHGHSSHHPRPIEVYRGKPILYGCGDLINDYEGISGYEMYRGELGLLYFLTLDGTHGKLQKLAMRPVTRRRFRLNTSSAEDAAWLAKKMDEECARLGCRVRVEPDLTLQLRWEGRQTS